MLLWGLGTSRVKRKYGTGTIAKRQIENDDNHTDNAEDYSER